MTRRSRISGLGLICAAGTDVPSSWKQILAGHVLTDHAGADLGITTGTAPSADRVTRLAVRAIGEAVTEAGWSAEQITSERTALIVGTSKGPIERWIEAVEEVRKFNESREPRSMVDAPADHAAIRPIIGIGETAFGIARHFNLRGPRLTLAAACASGLNAAIRADALIREYRVDRAIVIGVESSLHPLFIAAFARMGVIAPPPVGCRPFDRNRAGFVMSEAGAAVCLDVSDTSDASVLSDSFQNSTPARQPVEVYINRTAMAADAYHVTGVDPTGKTVTHLLKSVTRDHPIDLIHAHGTGTIANDPAELLGIGNAIDHVRPSLYSHKAAVGHTQGAAGTIGLVLNVLMHRNQIILPNANTPNPLPHDKCRIDPRPVPRQVNHSVVLAAGFGGSMSAVSLISSPVSHL